MLRIKSIYSYCCNDSTLYHRECDDNVVKIAECKD